MMICEELDDTRKAYGAALIELGQQRDDIVVCDADLSSSTQTSMFAKKYPERFFNVGVAEQNLMGLSAGLALSEKTVYASAFAMFGAGRAWEQIRNTIAYDMLNVKIVLTHAGITVGKDGSSHQITEDIALMRVIPNMRVQVPADAASTRQMVLDAAKRPGPHYIRLTREKMPRIYESFEPECEDPVVLQDGSDAMILSCGYMISNSLKALPILRERGIDTGLADLHTIKPLPKKAIEKFAKSAGALVTVEEHSIIGGMGSAVCELVCERCPVPVERVGIRDMFGKSGDATSLMQRYSLTPKDIADAVSKVCSAKK